MSPPEDKPVVESLLVTREFARSYLRLRPLAREHCDRVLASLLASPESPAVRLRPLPAPAGYHELRVGFSDRAIIRMEGSAAILIDVLSFREVAWLNAKAARRVLRDPTMPPRRQVARRPVAWRPRPGSRPPG